MKDRMMKQCTKSAYLRSAPRGISLSLFTTIRTLAHMSENLEENGFYLMRKKEILNLLGREDEGKPSNLAP